MAPPPCRVSVLRVGVRVGVGLGVAVCGMVILRGGVVSSSVLAAPVPGEDVCLAVVMTVVLTE